MGRNEKNRGVIKHFNIALKCKDTFYNYITLKIYSLAPYVMY